jgi:hypothetical protein
MALTGLHSVVDYIAIRDFLLKVAENDDLLRGNLSGLSPSSDGFGGVPIGYGFDLVANPTDEVKSQLALAGMTLTPAWELVLSNAHAEFVRQGRIRDGAILALSGSNLTPAQTNQWTAIRDGAIAALEMNALSAVAQLAGLHLPDESTAATLLTNVAQSKEDRSLGQPSNFCHRISRARR